MGFRLVAGWRVILSLARSLEQGMQQDLLPLGGPRGHLDSCNYWEQLVDRHTGEPRGPLRQLTSWAGFCVDHMSATADGKQLAYKRFWVQRAVYVAALESKARGS